MRIQSDRNANMQCAVATTAYHEVNFIDFLHEQKGIVVRNVDIDIF